jgi:hypothetical protein
MRKVGSLSQSVSAAPFAALTGKALNSQMSARIQQIAQERVLMRDELCDSLGTQKAMDWHQR